VLFASSAACGGKIADDGPFGARASSSPPPSSSSSSSSSSSGGGAASPDPPAELPPAPAPPAAPPDGRTIAEACTIVCDRNAQCGAYHIDCLESCEAHATGACGAAGSAYVQCYARFIERTCAALPPACEEAYCEYIACAGIARPSYCR